jgi:Fic family protein
MVRNCLCMLMPGKKLNAQPIGLNALVRMANQREPLLFVTHWAKGAQREERHKPDQIEITIPTRSAPTTIREHLLYALRYEALDLGAWEAICRYLGPEPFQEWIEEEPTGRHARRACFLYEWLMDRELVAPKTKLTNYVALGNPELQLTSPKIVRSRRYQVAFNLLGDREFCPLIRNTDRLREAMASGLADRAQQAVDSINPRDLQRAIDYLYHKETKASFQIEREDASASRMERFVHSLRRASKTSWFSETSLVELQNSIVDARYAESAYRDLQVYVGETMPWGEERVHYPCPKPEDVPSLMQGWRVCLERTVGIDPVCQAALIGFGFVFIHPFEDGNGRIHRFVIHATLARRKFVPEGIVIPVSATMLRRREAYDAALEAFSNRMMHLVEYGMNDQGEMTVLNETASLYRYWDATPQCEYLYEALSESLNVDLPEELRALRAYDAGLRALSEIVDMPNRRAQLLMRLLLQNNYKLSNAKRAVFEELTDQEIEQIETVVKEAAEDTIAASSNPILPMDFSN